MSQSPEDMSLAARLLLGAAATALGLVIEAVALGVIPVKPSSVHAPPWVILTAGGVFALPGGHLRGPDRVCAADHPRTHYR